MNEQNNVNPSENLTVVKDETVVEETPTSEKSVSDIMHDLRPAQPEQQQKSLNNIEKAQLGLQEIYQKYGIGEYHVAQALTGKFEEKTHTIAASNKMIRTEQENRKGLTEYHELIARDITAMKIIDGHNQEMQQYERNVIDTVIGWLNENASEEMKPVISIMCQELGLPYLQIVNKFEQKINDKVTVYINAEKVSMNQEITARQLSHDKRMSEFVRVFSEASKKERRVLIEKYLS